MVGLKFQTITVPSVDPETTCFRLGLNATLHTASLCPLKDLLRAGSPDGYPLPASLAFDILIFEFLLNILNYLAQNF